MLQPLGRTGIQVSPLGLGLAALGRPGYINLGHGADLRGEIDVAAMERNAWSVLDAAFDGGVRYFDAARSYGQAEAFLASWLERRGLNPDELTVGSKWGYTYTAGWRVDADPAEVKDLSAATLRRQLGESRALLGSHLRLYQIHSATLESGVLEDREVLEELGRLRERGVRDRPVGDRAGAGGHHSARAGRRRLRHRPGDLEPPRAFCRPALAEAHAAGLGVLVKEVLANGRLTPRGGDSLLTKVAAKRGTTPDALAFAAVLAQPWSDVALSGATTVEQLRAISQRSTSTTATSSTAGSRRSPRSRTGTGQPARRCRGTSPSSWNQSTVRLIVSSSGV